MNEIYINNYIHEQWPIMKWKLRFHNIKYLKDEYILVQLAITEQKIK
jgi:hypothetical protein